MNAALVYLVSIFGAATAAQQPVMGGVTIVKPEENTESTRAAEAIEEYRKAAGKTVETLDFSMNRIKSAPGARFKAMRNVLKAQGLSVAAAEKAKRQSEDMMESVEISGDLPTKEPPSVPDDLEDQAGQLAEKMGSGALGCDCAKQLYGDAATDGGNTRVTLLSEQSTVMATCDC
eukprot:gnl/MRDRNA2_/MRDRNA2_87970_c0_seq1.p1 gnl/MRDRNA2_/MRDRNA2_87970_c0~~gnl/MRDRNA2_/MRDRNA2_87970_c0_seq1.p1  ORF type:complete len:205 (-),score=51.90 gnl/MRDRNA2_/MRDRNA2_87970_c0_seq1:122-646(-)